MRMGNKIVLTPHPSQCVTDRVVGRVRDDQLPRISDAHGRDGEPRAGNPDVRLVRVTHVTHCSFTQRKALVAGRLYRRGRGANCGRCLG